MPFWLVTWVYPRRHAVHAPVASHALHPFAGVSALVQSPFGLEGAVHRSGFLGATHDFGAFVVPVAAQKLAAHPVH